jgi:predicted GIY-YIG superfamily endonuclease
MVYSESFETRAEAMAREKELKQWKNREAIRKLIESRQDRGWQSPDELNRD